ncbi:MAG: phosphate acyltransferase PlsX [Thermovenabulum sp.]|uniref:phosphate acyltransferase PlsX n=1 Tax=Thermovenabulum sp. TaxID=3100335 RepID=UPI003C7DF6A6
MKIIVDAMGGDYAPREVVKGAIKALTELNCEIILVGKEEKIKRELADYKGSFEIVNAEEVITNDESPVKAVRAKKDSSIVKGLKLLKERKGDAFVSAGNTGALMAAGLFSLGRISGIERPAIAVLIPTEKRPTLLLDVGANSDVKPKNLVEFAVIGSEFYKEIMGEKNPRIGLLNIGVEEEKGNMVVKSAYSLLKELKTVNFKGNAEARDFFKGDFDVVVCDGFTGNIFLKTVEGFGKFLFDKMKAESKASITYSIGGLLLKPALKKIKDSLDYSEYGGAILLGLDGVLVKCHGSSDNKAIFNGIKAALNFAKRDITSKMKEALKGLEEVEA